MGGKSGRATSPGTPQASELAADKLNVEPPPSKTTLPECDRRFRSAFAHAAVGMAIIDYNGVFVYANQTLCRLSGYEELELCGMKFTQVLHPDDRASRLDVFQQILAGEMGSFVNERRLLRKDGSLAWVRTSVTTPNDQAGPLQIIIFVEDITERKQTEGALRASEQRFRIAAENASDMIYEWDLASGQVDVFGPSTKLLGDWPLPRNYEAWKNLVHPDDLERILEAGSGHIEKGERYSDEYRIIGRSGKIYHYSNRGQAILNSSGEPSKCIGLLSDITESKLAEEAISQLAAIVRCSESVIIATDVCGAITTWNDGAEQLLGYTAEQSHGLPISMLLASSELARELLSQIQNGHSSRLDEALFVRQDGSQVPVLLSISPIRRSDGQVSGSAIVARDISARKQAEREMAYRALHDHLTGLPNRLSLGDQLAKSIASADLDTSGTAVIFVDLDGFKFVNDTLGHEAGDILLQQVAQRLSASVRRGDMLARMGGDEFMVVVNGVTDDQLAQGVADRLCAALRDPFFVALHELVITASMGISIYPRDGTDVSSLRRNADTAMYEAKQSGKNRIRFYRPALGAAVQARLEMETDLRRALDRGELCLHYQPIFNAANNRQTAYEALSRWPHPGLGFVPPSQFIALAEETGLIIRLGEWVLHEACRQCRWWQDHGKPRIRAAVNVSSLQFARPDFVDTVLSVLSETGLTGDLLDLELTESIVMHDIDSAIGKMAQLRRQGIRISVDDFGTGYSSLGYLPKLPIDILKIDRCFVAQIGENNAAVPVIQAMISLAHSINKRVIVEGVETAGQLEILRKLNCDEVQGFLLGRPGRLTRRDEKPQKITSQQLISA
jgi:diguanylate cyclase (GGDEF)-like protein/PAS domain S-box-containing protein